MTQGTLKIHSENILPIIKKWMYSAKDIFIRELVANACDALHKLKILRDRGEAQALDEEMRVDITTDAEGKKLRFTDTGIGMTADEVEKYIAQIAFSGAEDFLDKYKTGKEDNQIIGHFGLGFYSSYMVASLVEIDTLSYRSGSQAAHWECDGSPKYNLSNGQRTERGTEITLHISPDEEEFLEEGRIREILDAYCSFLPYPIYLNGSRINNQEPLWIKSASECTEEEYLEFYRHLFPSEPDPLFWIHLNVDYPFHLKGVLYFPRHTPSNTERRQSSISLYCNRVFVSDNCKDLIPEYLLGLRGVIDSPDIPLNVSRSYLQTDKTVKQLSQHISKKVADRLVNLYKNDQAKFTSCWHDLEVIVKLGAMQDERFYEKIKELLLWKNTQDAFTTAEDYLQRNNEKTAGKIYYCQEAQQGSQFLEMYKKNQIEVIFTNHLIDSFLIGFLERKIPDVKFLRIDGSIESLILDPTKEPSSVDTDGNTSTTRLAGLIKNKIQDETIDVEVKSLVSGDLPGFIVIDEEMRRIRDYFLSANPENTPKELYALKKQVFVVNSNHPLIGLLENLDKEDPLLTKEMVDYLYSLALLSQREMKASQLNEFVTKSNAVLHHLAQHLLKKTEADICQNP